MLSRLLAACRPENKEAAPPNARHLLEGDYKAAIETGRNRLVLTGAVFFIAFTAIGVRLSALGLLEGPAAARPMTIAAERPEKARGDIYDRNGVLLATSLPTAALYAHPREVHDPEKAAARIVQVLPELSRADVAARLGADRAFTYLARNLTPKQQYEINRLGIPGLYFEESGRRVYPQGPLFSHVVGLTDVDNKGIAGIEKFLDGELRDSRNPAQLSLDARVQTILREEMLRAVADFRAIGAAGMVMDSDTGEILAMASLPDFDPNVPASATAEAMFNRATLGVYEMGSTFKLFNTALALDSGRVKADTLYDVSKPIQISRFTINDYHPIRHPITVAEILVESSNIGSAKIAQDMGAEAQRAFLGKFGLLKPAQLELPEMGAPMVPNPWREINAMTISYGHGLAVTPLHLVNGVAALVNGGTYRPATLLRRPDGADAPGRQVVSSRTSAQLRQLMRAVVEAGTGSKAETSGYLVGGKTGTSEKLGAHGGYQKKALMSSFVGAFPMHQPRYVVLVSIDEPKATKETFGFATGGWIAAPVVSRTVARIGPMLGVPPVDYEAPEVRKAMQVVGVRKVAAN